MLRWMGGERMTSLIPNVAVKTNCLVKNSLLLIATLYSIPLSISHPNKDLKFMQKWHQYRHTLNCDFYFTTTFTKPGLDPFS